MLFCGFYPAPQSLMTPRPQRIACRAGHCRTAGAIADVRHLATAQQTTSRVTGSLAGTNLSLHAWQKSLSLL